MISLIPFSSLFIFTLILRTLLAISSDNFLFLWVILELNLLSFIPLITINKSKLESEAAVKYFLAQSLASAIFLLRTASILLAFNLFFSNNSILIFISFRLLLKIGAAPFHIWFPQVIRDSSWFNCIILTTWQKIIPLLILSQTLLLNSLIITLIASTNALVGGMGGILQTQLNTLIAYSSIGHLRWILAIINKSHYTLLTYFIIYITTTAIIILILNSTNTYSIKQITTPTILDSTLKYLILFLLLSIAGLPPFTGFIPKIIVIITLIQEAPLLLLILILGSFINISYYLNIIINLIISRKKKEKKRKNLLFLLVILALPTIPLFV